MEPGFLLSYYRPWNEDASLLDSWGDYLRDKSMVEYGAEKVGDYIRQASQDQIYAIREASKEQASATAQAAKMQAMAQVKIGAIQVEAIQKAAKMIGYQLEDTKKELDFLNRRIDIVIEQQRIGLMLQDNIAQLLKIPDSEKERQQAITLGIQFFVNASKDPDLFDDALEEFLKAESMKKQDYFVLHRIGCIYMFTQKHMDIPKALDYFLRAGKYSSVESDPSALRLANMLTNSINGEYTKHTSDPKSIQLLAGDSYEKAALASYILGDDENAINYQNKAIMFNDIPENHFKLGKYLARIGKSADAVKQLNKTIDKKPQLMDAILNDVDTASDPGILDYIEQKVREIDFALDESVEIMVSGSAYDENAAVKILEGNIGAYATKVRMLYDIVHSAYFQNASRRRIAETLIDPVEQNGALNSSFYNIQDGLLELIKKNSNGKTTNHFMNFIANNTEQLHPQVLPRTFRSIVFTEVDTQYCLFMALRKGDKATNSFKKTTSFLLFQRREMPGLDGFEDYVCPVPADIVEASNVIAQVLMDYHHLDNQSLHSVKVEITK